MLQAIHDRVMGIVGWFILAILFIAFAFFGLNSYMKSSVENYAAKVNDVEISDAQFRRAYDQQQARIRQALGDNYKPELIDDAQLRKDTLTKLVNEELVLQEAMSDKLAASDSALTAQIASVEQFRKDGVFSRERYTDTLHYQGMTPESFEWRLRREIIANELKSGILLTASGTEQELRRAYALQAQLRRFNYLVIPESSVEKEVSLDDGKLNEFYQAHPDMFRTPERVRVRYLDLDAAKLAVDRTVDEEQIKALYAEHRDKYVTPEQRHARHILITPKSDAEADVAAARKKAEAVIKRLDKGEDFATVAKEVSDDPVSAKEGGDLGTFGKGVMVPEVEQAVFGMKVGERSSQPVRSSFGFHIIELLGIVPEKATPIEQVRKELVDELLHGERNDQFYEQQDTLANLAFEQPDSLQGAAAALGLTIQESGWFSRSGGSGIADNPKVVAAAFSDDVLKNGNNSSPVEVGDDHVVVLRVADHQDAALPPLDEIRDKVTAAAHKDALEHLLRSKGDSLLAALNSGKSTLDSIAQDRKLELGHSILLPRTATQPSAFVVKKAFALPRSASNKPVFDGFLQPDGGYVLLSLEEVQDGNFDKLPESSRKQALRSLNDLLGLNDMQILISELRSRAEIHIPEAAPQ